jgi:hypothetical protein
VWDAVSGFVQYAIGDTSWFAARLVKIRFKNKKMRGIVIGYIVVQLVFAILAAIAIVMVVNGQKKPSCKGKCGKELGVYAEGTSCKDVKSVSNAYQDCQSECGSSTRWVSACRGVKDFESEYCFKCTSLKGSPSTYYIVAGVLLVLPLIVFMPIIFRKPKHKIVQS